MDVSDALKSATVKVIQNNSTPTTATSGVSVTLPVGSDLLMSFFKVNPNELNKKTIEQLNEIYSYAKAQTGSDDEMGILQVVRNIRFRLGEPKGLSEIDHIHNYIALKSQAKSLETKAQAMET